MREDIILFYFNWKLCVMFDSNLYIFVIYSRVMCIYRGIMYYLCIIYIKVEV